MHTDGAPPPKKSFFEALAAQQPGRTSSQNAFDGPDAPPTAVASRGQGDDSGKAARDAAWEAKRAKFQARQQSGDEVATTFTHPAAPIAMATARSVPHESARDAPGSRTVRWTDSDRDESAASRADDAWPTPPPNHGTMERESQRQHARSQQPPPDYNIGRGAAHTFRQDELQQVAYGQVFFVFCLSTFSRSCQSCGLRV
jgi:hypothetical protein